MKNKKSLSLVALAIFSIIILLGQKDIPMAYAFTLQSVAVGWNYLTTETTNCEYLDAQEVWCASQTGIQIFNPTTRSNVATLYSGLSINDIRCDSTYCYSWDRTTAGLNIANLTQWNIATQQKENTTLFSANANHILGHQIALISILGANFLVLPVTGSTCSSSPVNAKGLCLWDNDTWARTKFISSTDETTTARIDAVVWSENLNADFDDGLNRVIVDWRDDANALLTTVINLADSDSTFPLTQICEATTTHIPAGKIQIIGDVSYIPVSGGYYRINNLSTSCSNIGTIGSGLTTPTSIEMLSNGDFYYITSFTSGSPTDANIRILNSTLGLIVDLDIDNFLASGTANFGWIHSSEGEYQAWRGTDIVILVDAFDPDNSDGEIVNGVDCSDPTKAQTLLCRLADNDTNPLSGTSQLINQSSTNLICQVGILSCTQDSEGNFIPDNPDIQTNGVGYIMAMVGVGIMVGMFWVASRGDLTNIPTFVWFIGTIAVIGAFTAFQYIDPTFLVISVIAVVGFAVAKAKGVIGGNGGMFAGEQA